jgi:hypothetical protein
MAAPLDMSEMLSAKLDKVAMQVGWSGNLDDGSYCNNRQVNL